MGPVIVDGTPPTSPELVAMNHRLATLVIPQINFHDESLSDALEFLRLEARLVDEGEEDQRGINIFLKLPGARPEESTLPPAKIDLAMDHPTLGDALRAVAAKEGMKVKVEQYAVSLVPMGEQTDPMFTASVQVSPDFFGDALAPAKPGDAGSGRADLRKFLTGRGMTFPPGSAATYVRADSKLIVRETEENIKVLKKVCERPRDAAK